MGMVILVGEGVKALGFWVEAMEMGIGAAEGVVGAVVVGHRDVETVVVHTVDQMEAGVKVVGAKRVADSGTKAAQTKIRQRKGSFDP
eukprot:1688528-Prymnesium_polylepis.1